MTTAVTTLLDAAARKLSGYAALLNYRYMNLCVKAEPASLLSFNVEVDGEPLPFEKTAQVRLAKGREDQFEIFPFDQELMGPLVQAMMGVHPEFKLDFPQKEDGDKPEDRYILATMPEVDDNRHKVLMDAVGALADLCSGQMDATMTAFTAKLTAQMINASPDAQDEAKDALQDVYDKHQDMCKKFRANKEQEIEEAYQAYQEKQAAEQAEKQEKEASESAQAGMQMNWNPLAQDE